MRGNKLVLNMLSGSKKEFTEWDEAIFLAAFQVFENAITDEPNILNRFRYKPEVNLALKLGYSETQKELAQKVKKAKELFKWWKKYKRIYTGSYRIKPVNLKDKLIELADVLDILWD